MKVLTVGGGGREHAIVRALRRSQARIFAVMRHRNPGIAAAAEDFLLARETDVHQVTAWGQKVDADLAVVGPEAPLGEGLVDRLEEEGIPTVGPSRAAAQIELSKEFARDLMQRHAIPGLVEYRAFDAVDDADAYLESIETPVVVKPIGLTGGKGVKVMGDHLATRTEVLAYIREVLTERIGGQARVLVERKEVGEEFSLQAFTDGTHLAPMPAVQDYKRALEGDAGPNTGGMGSISDADGLLPFLSEDDYEAAVEILRRTVGALQAEGTPFRGVLYGGFILTAAGPKVLEFNARFGDPEAMNVLPILEDDFREVCVAIVEGSLPPAVRFQPRATVCKYVVPEGYGTRPAAGEPLQVRPRAIEAEGALLFYASVDERPEGIFTTSSRSLAVVGIAERLAEAERVAEAALGHVAGRVAMRHDIGTPDLVAQKVAHMTALRGN